MVELTQLFCYLLFSLFLLFSTTNTKKPILLFLNAIIGIFFFSMVVDGLSSHFLSRKVVSFNIEITIQDILYYMGLVLCTVTSMLLIWNYEGALSGKRTKTQKRRSIAVSLFSISMTLVFRKNIPIQSLSLFQLLRKSSVAFMEELIYRYVLTYYLYDKCFFQYDIKSAASNNRSWYLLCFMGFANILFAAAHFNARLFLNYFVFGCMMSVLLESTKSIYTVGLIHFLYNLFATL